MKIAVYYLDGRVESYDAGRFTAQQPFDALAVPVMTRFSLASGDMADGLWLECSYYDRTTRVRVGAREGVSLMREGFEIQILTREDLDGVAWVEVDGKKVYYLADGYPVNAVRFEAAKALYSTSGDATGDALVACELYDVIAPKLAAADRGLSGDALVAAVARRIGWQAEALREELDAREQAQAEGGGEDGWETDDDDVP